MNFLKSLGGLVGSSTATGGLPYVIDAPSAPTDGSAASAPSSTDNSVSLPDFHLFQGHSKADASHAVSIFKSKQGATQPTLNALKRLKTLRHPNILSYIDGVEMPNNGPVVLITEPVVTLAQYLDDLRRQYGSNASQSDEFLMSVAWGLRSVLLALQFLTVDCKLLHGRVHPLSVFVTKGGDWKLGGLELTGELTSDGPSYVYTAFEQFADASYKPPECQRRDWRTIAQAPSSAVDIYAFAALVYFVFNDAQVRVPDLANATNVPHALRMPYRKAVDADPRKRPTPDKFVTSSFFDTPFIKRMDFLENLAVKTPEEKVEFYKDLNTHLATLPQTFGVYKVLPALKAVVEFGASTASKNAPVLKLDPSASHMLPAMVQIGSSLSAEEFKDQVLPVIIKLFSCNDRAVRVQLLQMMEKFAVHLDAKLVNSAVIFDNLCSGFTDAAPVLRELTVKSMLHIADKLSDTNLNTRVMKYFAKLQTDPEAAIRTNTTICLGRIAPKLNDATRPKVLFPAFSRAMRDPFPHARLAGLRSLTACEEFFSPQAMAGNIVPAIVPLLLDVSISVREQAAQSMDVFMKKVMAEAVQIKIREDQQAKEQKLKLESGADHDSSASHASASGPALSAAASSNASVASSGSSYAASLTSWAASAVASKIVGSGSGSGATPPASTTSSFTSSSAATHAHHPPATSTPSASAFGSSSAATAAFASADDFGGDDDAWGEDDDLDGLGSPKPPPSASTFGSSFSSAPRPPVAAASSSLASSSFSSSSSSSMKLNAGARRAPPASSNASFAMPSTSAGDTAWGDDNWGGDGDLDFGGSSSSSVAPPPASLSSQFGTTSSRTSSFGSTGNSGSRTSSFGSMNIAGSSASTARATAAATASNGSDVSSVAGRKSVSERLAEAKAKRESHGAMKLNGAAKKKGDEWDNWDF